MQDINWFVWVFDHYKTLFRFTDEIYDFLFYEFKIVGLIDFALWEFVGGFGVGVILVAAISKAITPLI
jgi:hypothetical protein